MSHVKRQTSNVICRPLGCRRAKFADLCSTRLGSSPAAAAVASRSRRRHPAESSPLVTAKNRTRPPSPRVHGGLVVPRATSASNTRGADELWFAARRPRLPGALIALPFPCGGVPEGTGEYAGVAQEGVAIGAGAGAGPGGRVLQNRIRRAEAPDAKRDWRDCDEEQRACSRCSCSCTTTGTTSSRGRKATMAISVSVGTKKQTRCEP